MSAVPGIQLTDEIHKVITNCPICFLVARMIIALYAKFAVIIGNVKIENLPLLRSSSTAKLALAVGELFYIL